MTSTDSRAASEPGHRRASRVGITLAVIAAVTAFVHLVPRYDFDYAGVWGESDNWKLIGLGVWTTIKISVFGLLLSVILGIVGALGRLSRNVVWNQLAAIYVEAIRGTPLLVQILIANFCFRPAARNALEAAGVSQSTTDFLVNPTLVGIVTLGVFGGAYVTEIVRGALESIHKGQTEAALAQGMRRDQVFRLVLFPQAFRRMVPALTGQLINLVKDSSLLSVISVVELTQAGQDINSKTYATFEVFFPVALLYLAINFPLSRLARRLEVKLA